MSFFQPGPSLWLDTVDGLDASDRFISTSNGHEHGSFFFTQPGVYTLTFTASALENGTRVTSEPYTSRFGVEQPVPEPATLAALSLGAAALLRRRRITR